VQHATGSKQGLLTKPDNTAGGLDPNRPAIVDVTLMQTFAELDASTN